MSLCIVFSVVWLAVAGPNEPAPLPGVVSFQGAADVSAGVAIDRDLIAVADDEDNVLRVYAIGAGLPRATFDMTAFLQLDPAFPEVDIEAAARIGDRIYWIGSHSRNKDGKQRSSRCRFFATDIQRNDKAVSLKPVGRPCKTLLEQLVIAKSLKGLGLQEAAGVDQVKVGTRKKERKGSSCD